MCIILLILAVTTCFPAVATAGNKEATPLHEASENGHADGVKRLLAAGADGERERQRRTYENAGGGRWFLWAPEDVPLVARLAAAAGRSEEAGEVMERVRVAWVAEIATDKEGS